MKEALIVWGGWPGHEPEVGAGLIGEMLQKEGFAGHIETSTAAFADPSLSRMSLIVPIFTMSKIEKPEIANLSQAVREGVGRPATMGVCAMPSARRSNTSSCAAASGSPILVISSTIA